MAVAKRNSRFRTQRRWLHLVFDGDEGYCRKEPDLLLFYYRVFSYLENISNKKQRHHFCEYKECITLKILICRHFETTKSA